MQTKSAKHFRWRVFVPLTATSTIGLITMILLPDWTRWWWAGGMAVAVSAAVVATIRLMRGFRCPTCRDPIPNYVNTGNKSGAPINFYCAKCDVLWETGLGASDD